MIMYTGGSSIGRGQLGSWYLTLYGSGLTREDYDYRKWYVNYCNPERLYVARPKCSLFLVTKVKELIIITIAGWLEVDLVWLQTFVESMVT